jgi:hypothetical protein
MMVENTIAAFNAVLGFALSAFSFFSSIACSVALPISFLSSLTTDTASVCARRIIRSALAMGSFSWQ